jgi:hypothetical protein
MDARNTLRQEIVPANIHRSSENFVIGMQYPLRDL